MDILWNTLALFAGGLFALALIFIWENWKGD